MIGGLVSFLAGHFAETVKLRAYAAALYTSAAGALLFALVFALVALRRWLGLTYDLHYPELWIAGGFLVLTLILLGVGLWMQQRKPKSQPAAAIALLAAPPAARLAYRSAQKVSPRAMAVGLVLVAGVALGRRLMR